MSNSRNLSTHNPPVFMEIKVPAELKIDEKGTASIIVKLPDGESSGVVMGWLKAKTRLITFADEQGDRSITTFNLTKFGL